MKLYTTLNIIRQHNPCKDSWEKALRLLGKTKPDDDPLSFEWVLDNMGIRDAIWGLRAVQDKDTDRVERDARLFACDCAESVLNNFESKYPQDGRVRECINVSRLFARGETNDEARSAAWSAARSAAWSAGDSAADSAAWSAAWSAADSAADSAARSAADSAADSAARSAADSAEREKQSEIFRKYFCD
jgi:hypothetical protein